MSRIIAAIVISLIAGFAAGAWLLGDASTPVSESGEEAMADYSDSSTPVEERLYRLQQVVAEEREARIILEDQLRMLFDAIERIDSSGSRALADQRALAEERRMERRTNDRAPRDFVALMRGFEERRLNTLINGGFSEDEARRVMQQESEAQFQAMQAAHDAQRRGEAADSIYAMSASQALLRSELGDSEYERYLAAQGQPTAIQVTQVLGNSPGSQAGLQPGDQIVNYNGERVFGVTDLRALTLQGTAGEDVVIEIEREGVRMQLNLPRGPVGITGASASIRNRGWWGGT